MLDEVEGLIAPRYKKHYNQRHTSGTTTIKFSAFSLLVPEHTDAIRLRYSGGNHVKVQA